MGREDNDGKFIEALKRRNENEPRKKKHWNLFVALVSPGGWHSVVATSSTILFHSSSPRPTTECYVSLDMGTMKTRSWVTSGSSRGKWREMGNAKKCSPIDTDKVLFRILDASALLVYHHKIFERYARDIAWTECQLTKQDFIVLLCWGFSLSLLRPQ